MEDLIENGIKLSVIFKIIIFFSDFLLTFSLLCDIIISTKEKEDRPPKT